MSSTAAREENGITLVPHALIASGNGQPWVVDGCGAPVVDAQDFGAFGGAVIPALDRAGIGPVERLSGAWMFAGQFFPHFGHFIFDSLSRLWAHDDLRKSVEGVVFFSRRGRSALEADSAHRRFLDILGIDCPIRFVSGATEVDELYVPRPGCDTGPLAAGTPRFRNFMRDRLGRLPARTDAPNIYVSRSRFGLQRGGYLAEDHLETCLAKQGYTVFFPETETVETQISTYLGARKIISPDCSALHLFGFVGRPDQEVAILLRRKTGGEAVINQLPAFTGRRPEVIDAIETVYEKQNGRRGAWAQVVELDFAHLGAALARAGFISDPSALPPLGHRVRRRKLLRLERRFGITAHAPG